jgi:organic hydroperoxide reductase OsmC/OhrA
MPVYKNKVEWRGGHMGYTWCQNGVEMEFSAPPTLFGMADKLTPEDAFVVAANTCYVEI